MKYISTRGQTTPVSFSEAVAIAEQVGEVEIGRAHV